MPAITTALRPYLLPVTLILLMSALLLALDNSGSRTSKEKVRLAIVQPASLGAFEEALKGLNASLAKHGYTDGGKASIKYYNAQGDVPTSNDIARQVTNGSADLIISLGTLALQSVANANRQANVRHVFGVVTSAASAGVGVSATDPLGHPAWMTGYTSLVPIRPALDLAREFNPGLRKVGLVWHTSEASSQAQTADAREAAKALGIELIEANADSTSEVGPAAQSLVSRQVDALLITGDVLVITAADQLIKAARAGRIPVISVVTPNFRKGALFDLGADYVGIGTEVGELAAAVLDGAEIPKLPVLNKAPPSLNVNVLALEGLRDTWRLPPELLSRAQRVIDKDGERTVR
jgi:putative ABC transport system substrate-binding protein